MPNRFVSRDSSTVQMLTRVPVNRGSLLKSIDNLLKTIEMSENAVMIPTLLKDKVRVDACELLFVAKILKASILGHSDLVEFYMNHLGHTSSSLLPQSSAPGTPSADQLSPSMSRVPPSPMGSPLLSHAMGKQQQQRELQQASCSNSGAATSAHYAPSLSTSSTSSSANSQQSSTSTATGVQPAGSSSTGRSSASWLTGQQSLVASSGSFSSAASSFSSSLSSGELTSATPPQQEQVGQEDAQAALAAGAGKPAMGRQAQPPSLLQLTTLNNHINSVSDMFQSASQLSPSLEQLAATGHAQQAAGSSAASLNGPFEGLSISTAAANVAPLDQLASAASTPAATPLAQNPVNGSAGGAGQTQTAGRNELRSSRSASCLFRTNSGASSPRTPTSSYPQAETLAANGATNGGLPGDPSALVKLLLQVEQLKSSIGHCTALLESIVELYKKSIDNIA